MAQLLMTVADLKWTYMISNHFSGQGRAIGVGCVYVCVCVCVCVCGSYLRTDSNSLMTFDLAV